MPLNYTPISWKNVDPSDKNQMKVFLLQLSDFLNSAFNPAFLSFSLNGQGLLGPGAMSSAADTLIGNNTGSTSADTGLTMAQAATMGALVTQNLTVTTSPTTINASGFSLVFIELVLTGATNHTTTINNLASGVPVFWRLLNSSGAARTITVTATSPGAVSYTNIVGFSSTASLTWSSGVSVNNAANATLWGAAAFISGTTWEIRGLSNNV